MARLLRRRYDVIEVVGRGGQGTVVRAIDRMHRRQVAIKIKPVGDLDESAILAEGSVLLGIPPHPNLPTIREDFVANGQYHIVMDWIDGDPLQTLLDRRGPSAFPRATLTAYLSQVAAALDHLHAQHPPVVHGDVKPSNMVLAKDGRVVLVDLGISHLVSEQASGGTLGFVAPEVPAGRSSPASDVYGLAASAFTLLTGHTVDEPEALDALDPTVVSVVQAAIRPSLASDPLRRPGSASAFHAALATALGTQRDEEPGAAPELPSAKRRAVRLQRRVLLALALTIVMVSATVPGLVGRTTDPPPARPVPSAPGGEQARNGTRSSPETPQPTPPLDVDRGADPRGRPTAARRTTSALTPPTPGDLRFTASCRESWSASVSLPSRASENETALLEIRPVAGTPPAAELHVSYPDACEHDQWLTLRYGSDGVTLAQEVIVVEGNECVHHTCPVVDVAYRDPLILVPPTPTVGSRWSMSSVGLDASTREERRRTSLRGSVRAIESMTIDDRRYEVVRVDLQVEMTGRDVATWDRTIWFAPALGFPVRWTESMEWSTADGGYEATSSWVYRERS